MEILDGGNVCSAKGFQASGLNCGVKVGAKDLALVSIAEHQASQDQVEVARDGRQNRADDTGCGGSRAHSTRPETTPGRGSRMPWPPIMWSSTSKAVDCVARFASWKTPPCTDA